MNSNSKLNSKQLQEDIVTCQSPEAMWQMWRTYFPESINCYKPDAIEFSQMGIFKLRNMITAVPSGLYNVVKKFKPNPTFHPFIKKFIDYGTDHLGIESGVSGIEFVASFSELKIRYPNGLKNVYIYSADPDVVMDETDCKSGTIKSTFGTMKSVFSVDKSTNPNFNIEKDVGSDMLTGMMKALGRLEMTERATKLIKWRLAVAGIPILSEYNEEQEEIPHMFQCSLCGLNLEGSHHNPAFAMNMSSLGNCCEFCWYYPNELETGDTKYKEDTAVMFAIAETIRDAGYMIISSYFKEHGLGEKDGVGDFISGAKKTTDQWSKGEMIFGEADFWQSLDGNQAVKIISTIKLNYNDLCVFVTEYMLGLMKTTDRNYIDEWFDGSRKDDYVLQMSSMIMCCAEFLGFRQVALTIGNKYDRWRIKKAFIDKVCEMERQNAEKIVLAMPIAKKVQAGKTAEELERERTRIANNDKKKKQKEAEEFAEKAEKAEAKRRADQKRKTIEAQKKKRQNEMKCAMATLSAKK